MSQLPVRLTAGLLIVVGGVLLAIEVKTPEQFTGQLQKILAPGLLLLHTIQQALPEEELQQRQTVTVWSQDQSVRLRGLIAQNSRLQEQCADLQSQKYPVIQTQDTDRLFSPYGIKARILGTTQTARWRSGIWIDHGMETDLHTGNYVLKAEPAMIDIGFDEKISLDAPVLSGCAVIGTIRHSTASTSTVRKITDPDFRGAARLLRVNESGSILGAVGSLHGTGGPFCELKYIDTKSPVRVGDYVLATDKMGDFQVALFYGTVIEATMSDNESHWEIRMQPMEMKRLEHEVIVLSESIRPRRKGSVQQ